MLSTSLDPVWGPPVRREPAFSSHKQSEGLEWSTNLPQPSIKKKLGGTRWGRPSLERGGVPGLKFNQMCKNKDTY